jgi:hypothetical protein
LTEEVNPMELDTNQNENVEIEKNSLFNHLLKEKNQRKNFASKILGSIFGENGFNIGNNVFKLQFRFFRKTVYIRWEQK